MEALASHLVSTDKMAGLAMSTLRSGESPDFSLVPLRHSLKGEQEGYLITARWEWKCRLPIVASNSTSLLTGRDESLSSLLDLL